MYCTFEFDPNGTGCTYFIAIYPFVTLPGEVLMTQSPHTTWRCPLLT